MEFLKLGLLFLGSIQMVAALNITICDCQQTEVVGLMDIKQPSYCNSEIKKKQPIVDRYNFYITEQPHTKWKGHLCMAWVKERKITGYFFGSYDTIDTMRILTLSAEECRKMMFTHECDGNAMKETKANTFAYTASPHGEGSWMRTVTYSVKNCVVQEVTLKRDCLNCPITAPSGILTNNTEATSVITGTSTFIWTLPMLQDDERCLLKKVHDGTGIISQLGDGSSKIIDESNQLEFHYESKTTPICKHTFHKLVNMHGAYVEFKDSIIKRGTHLYNKQSKKCLNHEVMSQEQCQPIDSQKFKINSKLNLEVAIESNNYNCFSFSNTNLKRRECDIQNHPSNPLFWNHETKQISDGSQCLESQENNSVKATPCNRNENQQWLLDAPKHEDTNTDEEDQPLLVQHHQFIENKLIDDDNILQDEIKRIHCNNLQVRKFTTLLLAESNGLFAAMANNLPLCHRLKPNGQHLIIQKCKPRNITVGAKQTKCGYEPHYENYTIGRDGYSLHPFLECFWKDNIVNLNGKSFSWNKEANVWKQEKPTYHLATLKLTEKFADIKDNEYQFKTLHHAAYESDEVEQLNVINEMVTRIRYEDTRSISDLLQSKKAESQFWSVPEGVHTLQNSITIVSILVVLIIFIIICLTMRRGNANRQNEIEDFKLRVKAWRIRLLQRLQRHREKQVEETLEM